MFKAPMTTDDIMRLALLMVGLPSIPHDSGIHVPGNGIRKVLFALDVDTGVLMAAKQMGYDAVIAHHPLGSSAITFPIVLDQHVPQMMEAGVPEDVARQAIVAIKEKREVAAHAANNHHVDSIARLIGMPLLNIHFPLDQIGRIRMMNAISTHAGDQPSVEKVIEALYTLQEFRESDVPIAVRMGSETNMAGKMAISHGAGTNGGVDVARAYFNAGVETLIQIHVNYEDLVKIRTYPESRNLIITGHVASDLLGINPFIEELEKRGVTVDRVSGL